VELISGPTIEARSCQPTLGIRVVTPFRGMLAVRDKLWKELFAWLEFYQITDVGPRFLRLNLVDMGGLMDIEAGVVTPLLLQGHGLVGAGELPAGDFATLTYRDHSMRANKTLFGWADQSGVQLDRSLEIGGDRFACRYELILSDPKTEPMRTRWVVQLNARVAD
jgi:hypothetical protein